jgi:hypothetical protein
LPYVKVVTVRQRSGFSPRSTRTFSAAGVGDGLVGGVGVVLEPEQPIARASTTDATADLPPAPSLIST